MIGNYAVFEILHMLFETLNTCLSAQIPEVETAILVPSMDNYGNLFAIRYKIINKYSKYEFELTRITRKINCTKIKIEPI